MRSKEFNIIKRIIEENEPKEAPSTDSYEFGKLKVYHNILIFTNTFVWDHVAIDLVGKEREILTELANTKIQELERDKQKEENRAKKLKDFYDYGKENV